MSARSSDQVLRALDAMTPPERLRLAANLLEQRRPEIARVIVERMAEELGAATLDTQERS